MIGAIIYAIAYKTEDAQKKTVAGRIMGFEFLLYAFLLYAVAIIGLVIF